MLSGQLNITIARRHSTLMTGFIARKKKMKKLYIFGFITLSFIYCDCINSSSPQSVLEKYLNNNNNKKYNRSYKLLSTKSQELATLSEYINYFQFADTTHKERYTITKILELEKDINQPSFKRFKYEGFYTVGKDTIKNRNYFTLINENSDWKIVWNGTILKMAVEKNNKGDYDGAIKIFEKAIEIDPYDAYAYTAQAWCYNSIISALHNSQKRAEILNKISSNIKYAIALEPDIAHHFNALSMYFGLLDNNDLVIENYKKAIYYSLNEEDKIGLYANLSISYQNKREYNNAIITVLKAIKSDSTFTFAWFRYGSILNDMKKDNIAKRIYEKAIKLEPMEVRLQAPLYYSYSYTCFKLKDFISAKEYILKALEMDPDDDRYKNLYQRINYFTK